MHLIAEKKAAVLRAAAQSGGDKEIGEKSVHDRDLLTLLIKANMNTDIPESQRLSDEDVLARKFPSNLLAGSQADVVQRCPRRLSPSPRTIACRLPTAGS